MKKRTERTDDTGVKRMYNEAAPNPMFSEIQRLAVLFVHYEEPVPCKLCGKQRKKHWTCRVRFKAGEFTLAMSRWFPAGTPVCSDHPTAPDENAMRKLIRKVVRENGKVDQ